MTEKVGQQSFGFLEEIKAESSSLRDRFLIPPFTILDTRQGYWQDRKAQWMALGIQSELGRGEGITWGDSEEMRHPQLNYYRDKNKIGKAKSLPDAKGGTLLIDQYRGKEDLEHNISHSGTSIFDPVLCELMYSWFCPKNGSVLDPFAGGSVRGIVAHCLGQHYTGIDLSSPQVEANKEQALKIVPNNEPNWIMGDSRNLDKMKFDYFDFIFTCPPYFDLERYSDNPSDLSNSRSYSSFLKDYTDIIGKSINTLNYNRFACFVVANIRDKHGFYHDLVGDTVKAFKEHNVKLYNEAILVNVVGSLPIRINSQFSSGRKMGKVHQNVLIFYYGDPDKIKGVFGEEL